jgi:adenylate cyclase
MVKKFIKQNKLTVYSLLLSVFLILFIFSFGIFGFWQTKITDFLFVKGKSDPNFLIVAIDEKTLESLGGWPIDRKNFADLITFFNQSNPDLLAFDISFFEEKENDKELIKKINEASYPIVVSSEIVNNQLKYPTTNIKNITESGFVNLPPDRDGVVRKAQLVALIDDNCQFSYGLRIAQLIKSNVRVELCQKVFIKNKNITNDQKIIINYSGGRESYLTLSMIDVLNQKYPKDLFKDKIIFIGATAKNLHDEYFTPISKEPISGVEIQANIVDTIVNQKVIQNLGTIESSILIIILSIASFLLTITLKPFKSFITLAVVLFFMILISIKLFDLGVIIPIFYLFLSLAISFITGTIDNFYKKNIENLKVKKAFKRYVSPLVLDEILKNIDNLNLKGKKATVSILFSDIRGFTSISEKLPADKLVKELSRFLSLASKEILKTQGVVDKYIGDAIMAFWGAPLEDDNHALNACKSALAMLEAEKIFNNTRPAWLPEFKIGIGINTGEVSVGNIGSIERFDYTIIGDAVNLASRVESLTKHYKQAIILTENTLKYLKKEDFIIINSDLNFKDIAEDKLILRFLDKVIVKGKENGVDLYSLITKEILLQNEKSIKNYLNAYKVYVDGDWTKAEQLLSKYKTDGPSQNLLNRIKNAPPQKVIKGWKLESK